MSANDPCPIVLACGIARFDRVPPWRWLATHVGEQDIPGDTVHSPNWPHVAPGVWGASNATSPKYQDVVHKMIQGEPKIRILWVRGSHDLAVSDTAASDPGYLGRLGYEC